MDRRARRTKLAIKKAYRELLETQQASVITVTLIAKQADINRKTFYSHYDSIDDLIDEEIGDDFTSLLESAFDAEQEEGGPFDVHRFVDNFAVELSMGMYRSTKLWGDIGIERFLERIEPVLVDHMLSNDLLKLRQSVGPMLRYAVTFFCAGLLATYRQWIKDDSEIKLEDLAEMLSAAVVGGITNVTSTMSVALDGAIPAADAL